MTREPDGVRATSRRWLGAPGFDRADVAGTARDTTCAPYNLDVRATDFDELAFFRAIQRSGARALLIGRRALVVLGLPVLTADYDFWIAIDDIVAFNEAAVTVELRPTCEADAARQRGRYVLENDEHVRFQRSKA